MHIGFLGAGLMSVPMIENLLDDGHAVTVWNRTAAKTVALAARGARAVDAPAAVCVPGGVVLSCVADDAALEQVFADGTVIAALGRGGLHLSMSTVSAACAARLASAHAAVGVDYVAAPICGRPDAVKARRQTWLVSGPAAAKARSAGLLATLGRQSFDFGADAGAANIAKINFNFLIVAAVEALGEAFAVVEKSGLDSAQFLDMALATAFGCPLYEAYGRQVQQRRFEPALFKLSLGLKDVRLAAATATACAARMRLGALLEARFSEAIAHGHGDKDWTAVALDIRADAGLVD